MKKLLSLILALSAFSATSFAQTPQDIQMAIEIHQQKERIEVLDQSVTALKNEIIQAQALCPKQDGKVKFLLGSTAATMGLFVVRMFSNTLKPVEFIAYVGAMWGQVLWASHLHDKELSCGEIPQLETQIGVAYQNLAQARQQLQDLTK